MKKLFNNYCCTSSEFLKDNSLIMHNDIKSSKKNKPRSLGSTLLFMFIIINIAVCISYMTIDFIKTFYYTLIPDSTMLVYTVHAEIFKNFLYAGIGIYLILAFKFVSVVNQYNKNTISAKRVKSIKVYNQLKRRA